MDRFAQITSALFLDGKRLSGRYEPGRFTEEVGLVVPLRLEQRGDGAADPQCFLGTRRRERETLGDLGPGHPELVMQPAQCDDRRRMAGDRSERAWLRIEDARDGKVDERRGHR